MTVYRQDCYQFEKFGKVGAAAAALRISISP